MQQTQKGAWQTGKDTLVYRSEIKYIISRTEYETLRVLLRSVLTPDAYMASPDGYRIRSLYFDSATDTDYWEKLDGVQNRKKIRLRIYDPNTQSVKLEIKNRFGNNNLKQTLPISRKDAESLIAGDYDVLANYHTPVANRAWQIMRPQLYTPRTIVEYDREAYTYPQFDIRITFDKNVRAASSDRLFEENPALISVFEEPTIILEVKFNEFLPKFISDMLACCKGSMTSVSKYCLARDLLG